MRNDRHNAVGRDRDKNVRVGNDAAGHFLGPGGVAECRSGRQEFGRDDEPAGGDDAAEKATAADILDGEMNRGHVRLPWRPP